MSPETDVQQLAADYFLRRRQPDWSEHDEAELARWLQGDPARRQAYQAAARTWSELPFVRRPQLAIDAVAQGSALPVSGARMPPSAVAPAWPRRSAWAMAGSRLAPAALALALLVTGAGGWFWWDRTPRYQLVVANQGDDAQTHHLPDGSELALNRGSSATVRYYPGRREVVLQDGEAYFKVSADARRPFTVDVAQARITVVGTAFNVRAGPPALMVQVEHGRVHVDPDRDNAGEPARALTAGQTFSLLQDGSGRHATFASDPEATGAWRNGQIIFRHASLQTVAEELQRYSNHPIVLDADPRLHAMAVSGSAMTRAPEHFVQSLPHLLPVRVQPMPDGGWRISMAGR